jgi:hypothetical protein
MARTAADHVGAGSPRTTFIPALLHFADSFSLLFAAASFRRSSSSLYSAA